MDPVTCAARSFLFQAETFWTKHPDRILPVVAPMDDRAEVVDALRLGELAPKNRRPLLLYETPFDATDGYFVGLVDAIACAYEAVRQGVAEEGVEIPAFVPPSPTAAAPIGRVAMAMERAAWRLGERFDGATLALVPERVTDDRAWRGAVRALERIGWSPRVRVAVHAPPGGVLDGVLQPPGARLAVDLPALLAFMADLGAGQIAPNETAQRLRTLLREAAARTAAGEHAAAAGQYEQAAALCAAAPLPDEEAMVRIALGGAYMAAQVPELAVESYGKGAALAEALEAWPLSCVAWLGAAGMHVALGKDTLAAAAYEAAANAAGEADLPEVRDEAQRLRGECLRRPRSGRRRAGRP